MKDVHPGSRILALDFLPYRIPDQDPQHSEKGRITIRTGTVRNYLLQLQKLHKIPGQDFKHCFIVIQDDGSSRNVYFPGGDEAIRRGAGQAVLLTS
jgi:hypothetical protein